MTFTWGGYRAQRYEKHDFIRSCESSASYFGDNHAVGTSTEDVWRSGGSYNWIGTATQLKVSSSSAQDASGGTGAWNILLEGLDENWEPITETVTLTGVTPALTTASNWKRVNKAEMTGDSTVVGSNGANVGDVYVYTGTETSGVPDDLTKVYAKVEADEGAAAQAIYSVPAGYECGLSSVQATSAKGDDASIGVYVRTNEGPWRILNHYELFRTGIHESNGTVIALPAKTDIKVTAAAATSSVSVGATLFVNLRAL